MTILCLHPFNSQDKEKILKGLQEYYTIIFTDNFEDERLTSLAPQADVFLGMRIPEKVLDHSSSKLKLIQSPSAGVEKLPLSLLKEKGIMLCNSHSNSYYVAEYAISLLLTLAKGISLQKQLSQPLPSGTLRGKVVGILGYGRIGRQISEFLHPFGCRQVIFRRENLKEKNQEISFTHDLKEVLSQADYIIVTLPLTLSTNGLMGEKEFALMKKSASIVNVGRGKVINQEALYLALKNKTIQAAAIDVWYDDFLRSANSIQFSGRFPFEKLDNIILSPYKAAVVEGAPHLDDVITNLRLFATKGKVINAVDLEQGY